MLMINSQHAGSQILHETRPMLAVLGADARRRRATINHHHQEMLYPHDFDSRSLERASFDVR
jgi:hypothetical protein